MKWILAAATADAVAVNIATEVRSHGAAVVAAMTAAGGLQSHRAGWLEKKNQTFWVP